MRFDPRSLDPADVRREKERRRGRRGQRPPHELTREESRAALMERVQYMRDRNGGKPLSYTKFHTGGAIESTVCKLTGEFLQGLVPHENGKYLVQAYSPQMRHLKILFDDGSAHVSPISATGLALLRTLTAEQQITTLEYLYCCDMHQWLEEEQRGFGQLKDHAIAHRNPVGFEEETL